MASIIPGYEYDIFISYRQKDNKHDGWVTEFVDNLKGELESTFKEDISVYFDINPHDGLLETHDVDESLKEKLKCLVFIPIISRTYCDPKSFAWEHEFKVFVDQAAQDQYGLKVKLPGGNVANRVLPVQIHDLDNQDIKLCESVLGGVLRGIDFIYKSQGVNRPLKPSDNPEKSLNNTLYPDQINKVSLAVKDLIGSMKSPVTSDQVKDKKILVEGPIKKKEIIIDELQELKESVQDSSAGNLKYENTSKSIAEKLRSVKKGKLTPFIVSSLLGFIALWGWLRPDSDSIYELTTYSTIPVESNLIATVGQYPRFSISPDGRTIAITSGLGIQLRSLSDGSTRVLAETEGAINTSAFSPDGQSLVFTKDSQIWKIGINGSTASLIYSKGNAGPGLFWGVDGNIYFSPGLGSEGIWRVAANARESEQITSINDSLGENAHAWPQLLPDSKTLLYTVLGPSGGSLDSKIVIQNLQSGERKVLIEQAMYGCYLSDGRLLYTTNSGDIFTRLFDLRRLQFLGEPISVLSGVNTATWGGAAFISVSETGNMIYLKRSTNRTLITLYERDRSSDVTYNDSIPISTLEKTGYHWSMAEISPSGKQIALVGRTFGSSDIWLVNLDSGDTQRITFDPSEDETPIWSSDGKSIAYTSATTGTRRKLLSIDLDSTRKPHLITTWPQHAHLTSWSTDRKWLALYDVTPTNGTDIYAISTDSDESISIASSPAYEGEGKFSPDGRLFVYTSNETGQAEVYVVSFPDLEDLRQISNGGGSSARWDRNGKFIYYRSQGSLIAQSIELSNGIKLGTPIKLFEGPGNITTDGQKFIYLRQRTFETIQPLYLVTNWLHELDTKTGK